MSVSGTETSAPENAVCKENEVQNDLESARFHYRKRSSEYQHIIISNGKQNYSEDEEIKKLQMQELLYLASTFSSSAATALQRGSQGDWIRLRELLEILQPLGNALLELNEVQHYIHRLFEHILNNKVAFNDMKLMEVLQLVFVNYRHRKGDEVYPSGVSEKSISFLKANSVPSESLKVEENNNDLFQLSWNEIEKKLKPRQLSLNDIQLYLPRVVSEISRQEAVWKNTLGLTLLAANTCIPCNMKPETPDSYTSTKSHPAKSTVEGESSPTTSGAPKTGIQVVEYLVKNQSIDVTKIWYLNQNVTENYDPYDLVVVSRNRVRREHFVISVFGVLYVKPVGESELISLGQWYREAVVFKTISKIKYFRNYLVFKAFSRWKKNVKFLKFLKIRKEVKDRHLLDVPNMMNAILKVKSLLTEMQNVTLFPKDVESCYTLNQFNNIVFGILQNAKKYATRLYSHCQSIISKVEDDCLEYLQYCEMQMEQKTDNIKESMTLARQRRNKQIKNLNVAKYIEQKLPCFVRLIEEMLHQFLLSFISENVEAFVTDIMHTENPNRKGLFSASFEFDPNSSLLVLAPNANVLMESLKKSFSNVSEGLEEACMALKLTDKGPYKGINVNENTDCGQKLTVDELRVLLNCGPKEANEAFKRDLRNESHVDDDITGRILCTEEIGKPYKSGQLQARLDTK